MHFRFPHYRLTCLHWRLHYIFRVAWKEGCVEYWCEKSRKHMSRWTGRRDMTETFVDNGVKLQSINILQECLIPHYVALYGIYYNLGACTWFDLNSLYSKFFSMPAVFACLCKYKSYVKVSTILKLLFFHISFIVFYWWRRYPETI